MHNIRNKFVYVCSPLAGDIDGNMEKARYYCQSVLREDPTAIPMAPHIYFPQFTNENNPAERAADIDMGIEWLKKCSEIWVYGIDDPSEGMKLEIQYANAHGIKIISKPRLISLPKQGKPEPVIDPERVQFWKNTYTELNTICPEFYGDAHLVRRLSQLEQQTPEIENNSPEELGDHYACIQALQMVIREKDLTPV